MGLAHVVPSLASWLAIPFMMIRLCALLFVLLFCGWTKGFGALGPK